MKRQWQIHRTMQPSKDGQKRWDQAFLAILSIGQTQEPDQTKPSEEVSHASSDLCTRLDPEPGGRSND
jgi:hypothetical protein